MTTLQRQHESLRATLQGNQDCIALSEAPGRYAATREHLQPLCTAADAIIDRVRGEDSQRYLERVRQSGGE